MNLIKLIKSSNIYLIILLAFLLRILFASIFYGSYDTTYVTYYSIATDCGYRIYNDTNFPHPPIWFYLIKLAFIAERYLYLPLYYLIKFYSIFADIIIVLILWLVNKRAGLVYALSPVAILITSFHAQQDPIILLFLLLAALSLLIYKKNSRQSAMYYGLSLLFKLWPIYLLPVFISHINKTKNKLLFLFVGLGIVSVIFLPYLILNPKSIYQNVIMYKSTSDFGISIFLKYLPFNIIIKQIVNSYNTFFILIGSFLITILGLRRKWNIIQIINTIILYFYSFSWKIGAQYLLWVIPFGLLVSPKFTRLYSMTATLALIANYYGNNSSAFYQMGLFNIFTLGSFPLKWGITLSIWWFSCVIWLFYNLFFLKSKTLNLNNFKTNFPKKIIFPILMTLLLFFLIGYIFLTGNSHLIKDNRNLYFTDRSYLNKCDIQQINESLQLDTKNRYEFAKNYSGLYKSFIRIPVIPLLIILSIV